MFKLITPILLLSSITGCATALDSTLLGAGVGATAGAGIGSAAGSPNHNEIRAGAVGAVTGAVFGGLLGYLTNHEEEKKRLAQTKDKENLGTPELTKPIVRRVWVPSKIEGEHFIEGHFQYVIERPSVWRSTDDK